MDKSRLAAEEIVKKYFDLPIMGRDGNDVQDLIDRVTSALTQALREGYEDGHQAGFEEGYQKAIEDAVKVAETVKDYFGGGVGSHIYEKQKTREIIVTAIRELLRPKED